MPRVSVILPVYNAERFLAPAIESILSQTFTDFELILLNDGSTDGSEAIIKSYADPRIVYLRNEENKGLIFTLNKGIDEAKGEYIARMDADDISLPERLGKQILTIEKTGLAVLATRVALIDELNDALPDWEDDKNCTSHQKIKTFLLQDNCIAHPSVMINALLLKQYRYRYQQKYSEDYDLWLRLIGDGHVVGKLNEKLVLYRVLPSSQTRFKKFNVFMRLAKVKWRYAGYQAKKGKLNLYVFRAVLYSGIDVIKAAGKELKSIFKK